MQIKPYYDIAKYWPGALIRNSYCWWEGGLVWPLWKSIWKYLLKLKACISYGTEFLSFVNTQQKCLHICINDMYKNVCSQIWDMPGQYCLPQISLYSLIDYHTIGYALSQSTFWHSYILLNSP